MAAQIDSAFPNLYFNLGLTLALDEDYDGATTALTLHTQLASEDSAGKADELLNNIRASLSALN